MVDLPTTEIIEPFFTALKMYNKIWKCVTISDDIRYISERRR